VSAGAGRAAGRADCAARPGGVPAAAGSPRRGQGRHDEAEQALAACLQAQPAEPAALANRGIALQALGRFDEALACYAQSLARAPQQPAALNMQGLALLELKRFDEALQSFDQAVALAPNFAEGWCNRANALIQLHRYEQALDSLDRAEALRPNYGEAQSNRSLVLNLLGRHEEALRAAQRALALLPGRPTVKRHLADALAGLKRFRAALPLYDEAIRADPNDGNAYQGRAYVLLELKEPGRALSNIERALDLLGESTYLLSKQARALAAVGRTDEANAALDRALARDSSAVGGLRELLNALFELQRWDDALFTSDRVLALQADDADAHLNSGILLLRSGRLHEAEDRFRSAVRLRPQLVGAHNNLGLLLKDSGRLMEAEGCFREALRISPGFAAAYNNLSGICQSLGRLAEAETCLRRAVELEPELLEAHSNLLFNHSYQAELSPQACLDEARQYGRKVSARASRRYSSWLAAAAPQQLRVGLVSGDLRQHPVGHFLEGLLARLDPSRLEVFAYPTHHAGDALTERLRAHCAGWTPLCGLGDAEASRLIHADGIHVLIDLSGHTAYNRLPVFGYKPAPVQVTWLGYFATTGVAEIDYLLADPVSVPPAHQGHFSETIWYLPDTRLCFTPPAVEAPVAPLPALANGFVTFGSFQNLAKLNDSVLALWAKVLLALPDSQLRLRNKQLADVAVRRQLGQRLQGLGITGDRISMQGSLPREDYLAVHGEVDLILDTFPFTGGTTTCEALWMGVPTLTLAGDRLIGLQGASLLAAAGLREWIAATAAEYVHRALALAGDLPALATLRASLRAQVLASPLFNAERFATNLEDALWDMWRDKRSRSG